jgi:MFS family permease
MAACRLTGDRLSNRLGPVLLVRVGGLVAALGLGMGLAFSQSAPLLVGWALFGLGLAAVVPQVFSAAAAVDPARSGRNVALASGIGYLGMIAGPALIGALAQLTSLTIALALPAVLALGVAAAAGLVRPRPLI